MARQLIVRFNEHQYYDVNVDCEVVRFMATTSSGSFWSEIELEGPRSLRRDRDEFKQSVIELMQAGQPPCFVELSGEELH